MYDSTMRHQLSSVDFTSRKAHCASCGPVNIRRKGSNKWRCSAAGNPNHKKRKPSSGRWNNYGLSVQGIEDLMHEQGGVCAICSGPPAAYGVYVIDHDHQTKHVRGMLCSKCNAGLGMFGDSPEVLERAASYLRASRAGNEKGQKPLSVSGP